MISLYLLDNEGLHIAGYFYFFGYKEALSHIICNNGNYHIKEGESQFVYWNKKVLPIVKFDDQGEISNLPEIFNDVQYGSPNFIQNCYRKAEAWIEPYDKLCVLDGAKKDWSSKPDHICWGKVIIDQTKYVSGNGIYRILSCPDTMFLSFKNKSVASFTEEPLKLGDYL